MFQKIGKTLDPTNQPGLSTIDVSEPAAMNPDREGLMDHYNQSTEIAIVLRDINIK
jgi:hypothetical protein